MCKDKFDIDWELVNKIDKMALDLLKNGLSPAETQIKILNSELFQEWTSIERSFDVHYHDVSRFEDLLSSLEFDHYVTNLKSIALQTMNNKTFSNEIEWGIKSNGPTIVDSSSKNIFDRLFYQIGFYVSPHNLGIEIGELSKLMKFKEPIGLLEFLALFTNNESGLFNLEAEKLDELMKNDILLEKFKNDFNLKYKRTDINR
ncbi:hypothetical protein [Paenibacillus hamazuiensis]|uniref:hypothetical protein n=1 Tax=Paenibacillus hamazuiensis TaxID=2936508 RepID=UPI002010A565|nr:hypothetical protein [Paenibacillus hamazuiensis]